MSITSEAGERRAILVPPIPPAQGDQRRGLAFRSAQLLGATIFMAPEFIEFSNNMVELLGAGENSGSKITLTSNPLIDREREVGITFNRSDGSHGKADVNLVSIRPDWQFLPEEVRKAIYERLTEPYLAYQISFMYRDLSRKQSLKDRGQPIDPHDEMVANLTTSVVIPPKAMPSRISYVTGEPHNFYSIHGGYQGVEDMNPSQLRGLSQRMFEVWQHH